MGYAYSPGWRRFSIAVLRPLLLGLLKRDWRGREHIPRQGGVIIAANHVSEADPLAVAHFVFASGRYPVYLAKSALFARWYLRPILRGTGQIPVRRDTSDASLALAEAEAALRAGECLMFYPEGTCTRDPDLWPMTGQTGAARLALATGAPVVPMASWGAQELLPYTKVERRGLAATLKKGFHPFPRKTVHVIAGPALDLSRYREAPQTAQTLKDATTEIMRAIADLLGELRSERPPAMLYDHHQAARQRRQDGEAETS